MKIIICSIFGTVSKLSSPDDIDKKTDTWIGTHNISYNANK